MDPARDLSRLAPWLVLAALVAVSASALLAPAPVPDGAPATAFSAVRAMEHVRRIARAPHPMGTPALAEVRAYLVAQLEALGLDVERQRFEAPDYFGDGGQVPVVNLVARVPGTASTRAVALMAHYDTVPTTTGANDNTAAVATLLESARALRVGPPLQNDVLLFFTDAEEPQPRYGANALVRHPGTLDGVGLVVNFEASGTCGASVLAETSGPEGWLIRELAAATCRPAAFSCLTETSRWMGDIGTDFDCFRNAGVPGLHLVYLHGSPAYHTPADDVESVSLRSLQHHGTYATTVARRFGELDLSTPRANDRAVYFLAGPQFVHYPAAWALPLAVAAAVLALLSLLRGRPPSRGAAPRPVVGLLRAGAGGLLALVVGALAWMGLVALRTMPGVLEGYLVYAGLVMLCAWIATRVGGRSDASGALVLGLFGLVAVLTAVWLPGWSYVFTWPALVAGLARLLPDGRLAWGRYVVVAATTIVVMVPPVALFFQLAQPRPGNPGSEMPAAIALPLLLTLMTFGLLRTVWPGRSRGSDPAAARPA